MAILSDVQRAEVAAQLMREMSDSQEPCSEVKAIVRTLVNDIDTFLNTNAGAINNAITQPARSLSTPVKSRAFQLVARERYNKGV